jgi:hypothetical protein
VVCRHAMRTSLLLLATSASACLDQAHAQSAPRGDAGPRRDGASITGPRDNPDPHRASARSSIAANRALLRAMATYDAGAAAAMGDQIGDGFGYTVLGLRGTGLRGGNMDPDAGAPIGTIGLGTIGRGAGPGTSAGFGYGMGGMSRPSNARVLRQTVSARGTSLPAEAVRRILFINQRQLAQCFERPVVDTPPTHVSIRAQFEVARHNNGGPRVVVSAVEGASDVINACVRVRIGALRFPMPETDEPVSVTYTLSV